MTRTVLLSHGNLYLLAILCIGTFKTVASLFEQCNHLVDLKAGQKVYINSPYYPAEYPVGTSCRYTVHAPLDHELSFKCNVKLNVASGEPRCQSEIFYFNGEGSEILTESDYFCNTAKFERKSFLNRATISYISQPFFKRNLLTKTDRPGYKDDDENEDEANSDGEVDEEFDEEIDEADGEEIHSEEFDEEEVENDASTTTPKPALNIRDENFANAFTYLTELLSENLTTTNGLKATTIVPILTSTTVEGEIPLSAWRKRPAVDDQRKTNKTKNSKKSKFLERNSRIVSYNSSQHNAQYYGYIGNRGGGRFSCLVEVIEPPCDCGWTVSLKIAGATGVAGINEYPSMAGVKTVRFNRIFCGAAIIHHRYLISAAHCFVSAETNRTDLIRVVVGESDISTVLESLYTRTYEVEAIIPHELFYTTTRSLRNDIALLRTRFPIEWNRSVGPACLPFLAFNVADSDIPRKLPLPGQHLETAGWGTTTFGGAQSSQLLKTTLDLYPTDQCRKVLRSVPPGVFCTFTSGRDTCQYDSGGALYVRSERLFAVGIVSYGFACVAQQPSVNTRIASFTKWIKLKTPDASYCIK